MQKNEHERLSNIQMYSFSFETQCYEISFEKSD